MSSFTLPVIRQAAVAESARSAYWNAAPTAGYMPPPQSDSAPAAYSSPDPQPTLCAPDWATAGSRRRFHADHNVVGRSATVCQPASASLTSHVRRPQALIRDSARSHPIRADDRRPPACVAIAPQLYQLAAVDHFCVEPCTP